MRTAGLVLALMGAVWAEEPPGKNRGAEFEAKLERLQDEAAKLEAAGKHDHARALRQKTQKLAARFRAMRERRDDDRHAGPDKEQRALRALGQAIESLQAAGRREAAEQVAKLARDLKKDMAKSRERRMAEHHVEIMRLAFHAFREAKKGDWAELMEHAIHVRELQLAGRRDEEAREIMRKGPNLGAQAELLHAAAALWKKWGHKKRAAMCLELGKHFGQRWHKKRGPKNAKGKKKHGAARGEMLQLLERTLHRVEKLERRIAELEERLRQK